MYDMETVRVALAHRWNGGPWRDMAPDGDMPSAQGNPAHLGTEMAIDVDVSRAFRFERVLNPEGADLAYAYCGHGLSWSEMASRFGLTIEMAKARTYHFLSRVAIEAAEGSRIERDGAARLDVQPAPARPSDRSTELPTGIPWLDDQPEFEWGPVCTECHYTKSLSGWCECEDRS